MRICDIPPAARKIRCAAVVSPHGSGQTCTSGRAGSSPVLTSHRPTEELTSGTTLSKSVRITRDVATAPGGDAALARLWASSVSRWIDAWDWPEPSSSTVAGASKMVHAGENARCVSDGRLR